MALLWLGRGDAENEEWKETVQMARERRMTATERYLLGEPLVGEYWAEGVAKLGIDLPVEIRTGLR